MLISVLMSVYNSEETVRESVISILNQSYDNFEFLIVDDGSTDNTMSILKDLSSSDKRIKLFQNLENIGLTKSLNMLLNKSAGPIIARQDSDDISINRRFEIQLYEIVNKEIDFCTSRAFIKGTKKIIPGLSYYLPYKLAIKLKNPFIHGTLMARKEKINQLDNYDEKFYYSQDYKLLSDAIKNKFKVKNLNKKLYILNTHNNISSINAKDQNYFANCVKKNIEPKWK